LLAEQSWLDADDSVEIDENFIHQLPPSKVENPKVVHAVAEEIDIEEEMDLTSLEDTELSLLSLDDISPEPARGYHFFLP